MIDDLARSLASYHAVRILGQGTLQACNDCRVDGSRDDSNI
jgi:hypothetical protein